MKFKFVLIHLLVLFLIILSEIHSRKKHKSRLRRITKTKEECVDYKIKELCLAFVFCEWDAISGCQQKQIRHNNINNNIVNKNDLSEMHKINNHNSHNREFNTLFPMKLLILKNQLN